MLKIIKITLFLLLFGCSNVIYTNGVPNLYQVNSNVWRSGQPTTIEAWEYLYKIGVRHSVKLNFDTEGTDDLASLVGIEVHKISIEPRTNPSNPWNAVLSIFEKPNKADLDKIEGIIEVIKKSKEGWVIHCYNGHDRTGYVVGRVRVKIDGWSKKQAWKEMIKKGFHPEIIGLVIAWIESP
jgi:protein-tyrosine phosphatase